MNPIPVVVMGLSSILLQITVLRQLLSVFSGNELDIGITLSVWLLAVGIGSYTGWKIKYKEGFALSFLAVSILSQLTIIFINAIRPLLSLEPGEAVSLVPTVFSTALSLLPLCLVMGFQFPLAISYLKSAAAKVYGIEAAAAFTGGVLFTFMLSGRVGSFALVTAIAFINTLTSFYLLRKKALIPLLLFPLLVHYGVVKTDILSSTGMKPVKKIESRYGEIAVTETKGQSNLYLSGKLTFSYPDPQAEEMRAHIPGSVHPSPKKILVIGGSPAVLREFLKYDIEKIDFVELDPVMIDVSLGLLSSADLEVINDERVRMATMDGRRFVKSLNSQQYELVVINLPEPATANINRFYTMEFFREAESVLKEGGVFSLTLPTSSGYIGKRMQMANGTVYNTLKGVFRYVEVSSEEYGCIFASGSPLDTAPNTLEERFLGRGITTSYFQPYIFKDAFSPLKTAMVKRRLDPITSLNTDIRPLAYLYNLMLWGEVHGSGWLNLVLGVKEWQIFAAAFVLSLIAAAFYSGRAETVYYSVLTTGFAGIAFSLIIILAYQARYGYVYEMFGLLTATFMLGIAAGAYAGRGAKRPLMQVRLYEATMIALFISAPLFFKSEPLYYILSLLCGFLAGGEFAAANSYMKVKLAIFPSPLRGEGQGEGGSGKIAGTLYGIDLIGSFLGAMLTALLLVPLLGIQNTIYFVVLLKVFSLVALFTTPPSP